MRSIVPNPVYWMVRRRLKQYLFSPGFMLHQLRWYISSSSHLAQWTERQLQVSPNFWLFIIGLNNSGTTMLSRILDSHPLIRSMPKPGGKLTNALPRLTNSRVGRNWTQGVESHQLEEEWSHKIALRIQYDWAHYYASRPGILLEKSPKHTLKASWFQDHFCPSRFLAVVRNPYAVCEGIRRRVGIRIEDAAIHWTKGNQRLLEEMKHLDHCLLFTYEEFCAQPAEQLRQIQKYLGLESPFDSSLSSRPVAAHNIVGAPQMIRNLNTLSLDRLSREDIAVIDRIAGPLMEQFGYDRFQAVS